MPISPKYLYKDSFNTRYVYVQRYHELGIKISSVNLNCSRNHYSKFILCSCSLGISCLVSSNCYMTLRGQDYALSF